MKSLIPLICLLLISCSKGRGRAKTEVVEYFTKGNPLEILEGTESKLKFVTESNFKKNFNEYSLVSIRSFSNIGRKKSSEQRVSEQTPENRPKATQSKPYTYVLTSTDEGETIFELANKDKEAPKIYFSTDFNNELQITRFSGLGLDADVEPIHYSIKEDKSAFSVLFHLEDEGYKVLMDLTFVKNFDEDVETAPENYFYIGGVSKARWLDKEVKISNCAIEDERIERILDESIEAWNSKVSNVKLENKKLKKFPPYSDLNTQCVYVVENYFYTAPDSKGGTGGVTYPVLNISRNEIIDSDIIIPRSEWEKSGADFELTYFDSMLEDIMIHELGHFLGLDHNFTGTKSIMSYNPEHEMSEIYDYDVEALEELYR